MLKKALKHDKCYKKHNIWNESDYKESNIDIYNSHFMGDCKYYNLYKLENYSFIKELYEYKEKHKYKSKKSKSPILNLES